MSVEVKFSGEREVRAALKRLGDSMRADVLKEAVEDASEPIVRDAKRRAPSDTIRRGIRVVDVVVENRGEVRAVVGLPGGRHPWFHGLFIERGTGPRQHKSGKSTGSMPAQPFLRPAFDAKKVEARARFAKNLKARLEREARG